MAATGTVRVRLMVEERAAPGAQVRAVRDPGVQFQERIYEAAADGSGTALLRLPPGDYYVTASTADGDRFGYYGPNPAQVRAGDILDLSIPAVAGNTPPRAVPAPAGEVDGIVVTAVGPLAGAGVAFYLDASGQFRGPGYVEVSTDGAGRFSTALSSGRYWVVVRKRRTGAGRFGPLDVGDFFGYWAYNPLAIGEGERVSLRIGAVEVLRRAGWSAPSALRTRISGVIRDGAGRPLAGWRAILHTRPEMLGKPAFASEASGPDGAYEIWVDHAGTYYLGARRRIGVAREASETVGRPAAGRGPLEITPGAAGYPGRDIVVTEGGREGSGS